MSENTFETQNGTARHRLIALKQQANTLLDEILAELTTGSEELHAAMAQRQRYKELFDLAPDGYLVTDSAGIIKEGNLAARTLLNVPAGFLLDKPLVDFVTEADRKAFRSHLVRLEQLPAAQNWEVRLQRHNGPDFSAVVNVAGTRNADENRAELRWIIRDITERQNLEARVLQSRKLESISQLAGGVAFDFNNILTVIQGHASLMQTRQSLPPRLASQATQISLAADRAGHLTRQLLTFSRRQAIQPKDIDLNAVVGGMTKMVQRILGEEISLHVNFGSNLPLVSADAGMLEQVLLNLAINSRDAMPQGGRLLINTAIVIIDAGCAQQEPDAIPGECVCLSVTDTGCGIPPEHMTHIFEPFFTTKEVGKGTGLGLATVYGIVKQHQGWIKVTSRVNEETTFQIFLPGTGRRDLPAQEKSAEQKVRGGTETILLVEDEAAVRDVARAILEDYGYRVFEAATGVAALALWQEHKDQIQLLLTDVVMPEGVTGLELAQRLQAEKAGLKVVYSSGHGPDILSPDLNLSAKCNFLQKPYPPPVLARTVRDCLDMNP